MTNENDKTVSLTFRGLEVEPSAVEQMLGLHASEIGKRGSPVRAGIRTPLKRSFASFSVKLDQETRLDQVIPLLLDHLGGVAKVTAAYQAVMPEFFELDIVWPVKSSDEQEGGFLPPAVISDLASLRCTLTFAFLGSAPFRVEAPLDIA